MYVFTQLRLDDVHNREEGGKLQPRLFCLNRLFMNHLEASKSAVVANSSCVLGISVIVARKSNTWP